MTLPGRRAVAVLAVALLLAGCAGCAGSTEQQDGTAELPERSQTSAPATAPGTAEPAGGDGGIDRYVALGDSYTSAPYVGVTAIEDGCLRSEENYPVLFAEANDVGELVDVSCAGATTADLVQGQRPFGSQVAVPPQLDAVTDDTDLVTVGIGGNDTGLFGRVARSCLRQRPQPGDSCVQVSDGDLAQVGRNVRRALDQVQRRAPEATVVLVGYPRIVDDSACPRRLPVRQLDVEALSTLTRQLDEALAAAARHAGVEYLDLHAASASHDVCSDEPWVNGSRNLPGTALALHPLAAGQQAVARLLEQRVGD